MAIACLGGLTPALSCWIVILANQPGATSWLLDKKQQGPDGDRRSPQVLWSYAKGDKMVDETRLCADA